MIPRAALLAYAALALAPLAAVLAAAPSGTASTAWRILEPRNLRALGFTLSQAAASTAAALLIGLPGAALVARYRFPGRRALKSLSVLPFSMPALLVILAFALFYGRSGFLNSTLMRLFGLDEPPLTFLYGFWGIVLVHGFYEFPLVTQIVGEVWERLPRDRGDAARLLGAGRLRAFMVGGLPSLVPAIAQAAALCFLLCFFSFAVVMVFGSLAGSTLEVEVYRRARLEGDIAAAGGVALLETCTALMVVALLGGCERWLGKNAAAVKKAGGKQSLKRPGGTALLALALYALFLLVFFFGPLAALALEAFMTRSGPASQVGFGFANFARLLSPGSRFLASVGNSLLCALPAAGIATILGAAGAFALRRDRGLGKLAAQAPMAVSGIAASLGWSLMLPRGGVSLIPLVQALGVMPYVMRSVSAALETLDASPAQAARVLGASAGRAALGVELPAVRPALLAAAAFAFAAALGDLNVALLLGRGGFETLPVYLYRLISAYRFSEAAAAGLVLGCLTVLVFALKEGRVSHA